MSIKSLTDSTAGVIRTYEQNRALVDWYINLQRANGVEISDEKAQQIWRDFNKAYLTNEIPPLEPSPPSEADAIEVIEVKFKDVKTISIMKKEGETNTSKRKSVSFYEDTEEYSDKLDEEDFNEIKRRQEDAIAIEKLNQEGVEKLLLEDFDYERSFSTVPSRSDKVAAANLELKKELVSLGLVSLELGRIKRQKSEH